MIDFTNKVALISGGASGIGLALARAFGKLGAKVVLADINNAQLAQASKDLSSLNIEHYSLELDVTEHAQWQRVVTEALDQFGQLDIVVNNAGVGGEPSDIKHMSESSWRWVLDVNVMGVMFGAQSTINALKQNPHKTWLINVASMAGMLGVPYSAAYAASKAAVVSMSESWAAELKQDNVCVKVLCPAFVQTNIHLSADNRQAKYGETQLSSDSPGFKQMEQAVTTGIRPELLADRVLEALGEDDLYIFTHPNYKPATDYRAAMIAKAFDKACDSDLVKHLQGKPMFGA